MKIQKLVLFFVIPGVLLGVGCGQSAREDVTSEPDPVVRGEKIASLANETANPEPPAAVKPPESAPVAEPVKSVPEVKPVARPVTVETPAVVAKVKPAPAKKVETAAKTKPAPVEPNVAKKAVVPAAPEMIDGEFFLLGFDKLASFEYEVPEEEYDPDKKPAPKKDQPDQIPAKIKAYDKKRVALKGFMMPLKVEDGLITELLVMRDQSMCCYGTVPKINEWVSVKMTGKGIKPIMDQAVTLYGKLKVGEIRENGYLVGIYEMDGEKMTGPLDL